MENKTEFIITASIKDSISADIVNDIFWLCGVGNLHTKTTTLPESLRKEPIFSQRIEPVFTFNTKKSAWDLMGVGEVDDERVAYDLITDWLKPHVDNSKASKVTFGIIRHGNKAVICSSSNLKSKEINMSLKMIYALLNNTKDMGLTYRVASFIDNSAIYIENKESRELFQKIVFKLGGCWNVTNSTVPKHLDKGTYYVKHMRLMWGLAEVENVARHVDGYKKLDLESLNALRYDIVKELTQSKVRETLCPLLDIASHHAQQYFDEPDRHVIKNIPLPAAFVWKDTKEGELLWSRMANRELLFSQNLVCKATDEAKMILKDAGYEEIDYASTHSKYLFTNAEFGIFFYTTKEHCEELIKDGFSNCIGDDELLSKICRL